MGGPSSEGVFALRLAVWKYAALVPSPGPWLSERDRFDELLFALFTRIADRPEVELRQLVEELRGLGLLDVATLAAVPVKDGLVDADAGSAAQQLLSVFDDSGLTPEVSQRLAVTLVELAGSLQEGYGGKVQRYLRGYGERMLRELGDSFRFTQLPPGEVLDAFTYWLQNAALMPLSLIDENVRAFATAHGLSEAELIACADEIDLNLAWMDDVVERAMRPDASEPDQTPEGG